MIDGVRESVTNFDAAGVEMIVIRFRLYRDAVCIDSDEARQERDQLNNR